MKRKQYLSNRGNFSTCGDLVVRGDVRQIALKYEDLAREAQVMGDLRLHHIYLNHAEHYRKGPDA